MGRYKVELCGVNTAQLPVLKNQEMTELFVRMRQGDSEAKEQLVSGNLKLVLSIVQRFAHRAENMDDLFQIGCIGLIKAIDHFDLNHEVRFSTYAVPMIIGEIKRYLRDNQMIRVSRHLKDLAYKVLRQKEKMTHEWQREPTLSELAERMGLQEKEVAESLESLQSVVSIFEPVYNDDGDPLYLLDQIRDEHDEIGKLSSLIALKESMKHLNPREAQIINRRYYQGQTQTEIAAELGISQAQVSRLEKSALECLKKNF